MATITGLTAARMQEIEAASVVDGEIVDGDLILTKFDGTEINAGPVVGPAGPPGPQGSAAIPGEIKLWPGTVLPDLATFGLWSWANGDIFNIAEHPLAAANIDQVWRTAMGLPDPGVGKFRVPDLRGLVPAAPDALPIGSTRANRMTRAAALNVAAKTGEEAHRLVSSELAAHNHGGATGAGGVHYHDFGDVQPWTSWPQVPGWVAGFVGSLNANGLNSPYDAYELYRTQDSGNHSHGIGSQGNDIPHETVQPTVFVPYIVCLDQVA